MVTTAGYEGRPWEPNAMDYLSGEVHYPDHMIVPPGLLANGFVYRCVRRGRSGSNPPAIWPTTIGTQFDDTATVDPARWECVGVLPRYQYYGACV